MPKPPLRLVIDTNVALDLLIFADPTAAPIAAALRTDRAQWLYDVETRAEFERVLAYPELKLDAAKAAAARAEFSRLAQACPEKRPPALKLPQCRDPDDQKFLELAFAGAADLLITRDRALLRMARRINALSPSLHILTPAAAAACFCADSALPVGGIGAAATQPC